MAKITPFRAALADLTDIISFDNFYGTAKRKFPLYLSDGIYEQIDQEAIYIYRVKRTHRSHTGIIAGVSVLDSLEGKIKKHENTLAAKEARMMFLFEERNAMIKPVLLTYPNVLEIDALLNRITSSSAPSFVIPFQDEEHIFWQIEEPIRIQAIQEAFDTYVPQSYICDGHHRVKTSELLYEKHKEHEDEHVRAAYANMMVAYFPASEVEIHNYNRLIVDMKGMQEEDFLVQLKEYYTIEKYPAAYKPLKKHQMGMIIGKQWYKLTLKEIYLPQDGIPTKETLDVYFLNKYVLEGILKIEDVRTEPNIKYIEGPKGGISLERKIKEHRAEIGFNLYPVALEDLIKISDEGGTLPPKSTWIEPRMRNGFVTQLYFDEQ